MSGWFNDVMWAVQGSEGREVGEGEDQDGAYGAWDWIDIGYLWVQRLIHEGQ